MSNNNEEGEAEAHFKFMCVSSPSKSLSLFLIGCSLYSIMTVFFTMTDLYEYNLATKMSFWLAFEYGLSKFMYTIVLFLMIILHVFVPKSLDKYFPKFLLFEFIFIAYFVGRKIWEFTQLLSYQKQFQFFEQ